jgi:hypothetical protein
VLGVCLGFVGNTRSLVWLDGCGCKEIWKRWVPGGSIWPWPGLEASLCMWAFTLKEIWSRGVTQPDLCVRWATLSAGLKHFTRGQGKEAGKLLKKLLPGEKCSNLDYTGRDWGSLHKLLDAFNRNSQHDIPIDWMWIWSRQNPEWNCHCLKWAV